MSDFELRIEPDARLVVAGEVDAVTAPRLTSAIECLVSTNAHRVFVDLAGVSFMDSSGLAALCLGRAKLEANGLVLVLGRTSTPVQALLRTAGVESSFVQESPGV